jgi:hypothetical protein
MRFYHIAINSEFAVNKRIYKKVSGQEAVLVETRQVCHFEPDAIVEMTRGTIFAESK